MPFSKTRMSQHSDKIGVAAKTPAKWSHVKLDASLIAKLPSIEKDLDLLEALMSTPDREPRWFRITAKENADLEHVRSALSPTGKPISKAIVLSACLAWQAWRTMQPDERRVWLTKLKKTSCAL